MKKLLAVLAFLAASTLTAQVPAWNQWSTAWVRWDGGLAVPAGYLTIKDETTALAQQSILSFLGAGVTCVNNAGNSATECTISGGSTNALLDGSNHTDTLAGTVVRGDMIIGNSTPKWARLAVGGANTVMTSNGTDPSWGAVTGSQMTANTVGNSQIRQSGALSVIGRSANSTGNVADISATALTGQVPMEQNSTLSWINPFMDPQTYHHECEFEGVNSATGCNTFSTGTGAAVNRVTSNTLQAPGAVTIETGTTTTGRSSVQFSNTEDSAWFIPGGGPFMLRIGIKTPSANSNGTDTYNIKAGLCDTATATTCSDGIWFSADSNANAAWQIKTSSNGTATTATATGSTINTSTVYDLLISCNSGATSCNFYINGSEVANSPITTNIPNASGRDTAVTVTILKAAGTTNIAATVDYIKMWQYLTTAR